VSLEKARGDHDPADLGQLFLLIWMGSTLVNQVFSISSRVCLASGSRER